MLPHDWVLEAKRTDRSKAVAAALDERVGLHSMRCPECMWECYAECMVCMEAEYVCPTCAAGAHHAPQIDYRCRL